MLIHARQDIPLTSIYSFNKEPEMMCLIYGVTDSMMITAVHPIEGSPSYVASGGDTNN